MKNSLLKSSILVASVFALIGCGSGSSDAPAAANVVEDPMVVEDPTSDDITSVLPADIQDAIDSPKSVLTEDLKDSITYMYNEEGLAYDVYMHIYNYQVANNLPTVNQLVNIASNSEIKHIDAVNELAIKYDLNMTTYDPTLEPYSKEGIGDGKYTVPHIQVLYDALYPKGIKSKQDALEVGCMVEVVDIVDLQEYIHEANEANASDVLEVFDFLITGSYAHYWAFDDGLKNMGISEGCCSVTDEFSLGLDFCHPEYPKK